MAIRADLDKDSPYTTCFPDNTSGWSNEDYYDWAKARTSGNWYNPLAYTSCQTFLLSLSPDVMDDIAAAKGRPAGWFDDPSYNCIPARGAGWAAKDSRDYADMWFWAAPQCVVWKASYNVYEGALGYDAAVSGRTLESAKIDEKLAVAIQTAREKTTDPDELEQLDRIDRVRLDGGDAWGDWYDTGTYAGTVTREILDKVSEELERLTPKLKLGAWAVVGLAALWYAASVYGKVRGR